MKITIKNHHENHHENSHEIHHENLHENPHDHHRHENPPHLDHLLLPVPRLLLFQAFEPKALTGRN